MPLQTFLRDRPRNRVTGLALAALTEIGVIQSPTGSDDSGGGATYAWQNVGTVPCRIDPLLGRSLTLGRGGASVGDRINERSAHQVITFGTALDVSQRIYIQNWGTFEVTASSKQTHRDTFTAEVADVA